MPGSGRSTLDGSSLHSAHLRKNSFASELLRKLATRRSLPSFKRTMSVQRRHTFPLNLVSRSSIRTPRIVESLIGSEVEIVSPAKQCLTTSSSEETEIFVTPRKLQAIRAHARANAIRKSPNISQSPNRDSATRAADMESVSSQKRPAQMRHPQANSTGAARSAQWADGRMKVSPDSPRIARIMVRVCHDAYPELPRSRRFRVSGTGRQRRIYSRAFGAQLRTPSATCEAPNHQANDCSEGHKLNQAVRQTLLQRGSPCGIHEQCR